MKQRRDKWLRWIDTIDKEIIKLVLYNHLFWEVQEIIKKNNKIQKPSAFYDFLLDTFMTYMLMGVRRQVKIDAQSISFARLLKEIYETPDVLSRQWFVSLYKTDSFSVKRANKDFDKYCGRGKAKNHIDKDETLKDLVGLKIYANKLEELADKRIAHRDIREPKSLPTFKDLKECIDYLDKLLCKYYLLFKALSMSTALPTLQYDWKTIFGVVWQKHG